MRHVLNPWLSEGEIKFLKDQPDVYNMSHGVGELNKYTDIYWSLVSKNLLMGGGRIKERTEKGKQIFRQLGGFVS